MKIENSRSVMITLSGRLTISELQRQDRAKNTGTRRKVLPFAPVAPTDRDLANHSYTLLLLFLDNSRQYQSPREARNTEQGYRMTAEHHEPIPSVCLPGLRKRATGCSGLTNTQPKWEIFGRVRTLALIFLKPTLAIAIHSAMSNKLSGQVLTASHAS